MALKDTSTHSSACASTANENVMVHVRKSSYPQPTPQLTPKLTPQKGRVFVEALDSIDVALWQDHMPVGESYLVDCEISGALDSQGFVVDFSHLKKSIKEILKAHVDHRLVLPLHHPDYVCTVHSSSVLWQSTHKTPLASFYYCGPSDSVVGCESAVMDKTVFATWVEECIKSKLLTNPMFSHVTDIAVTLRGEEFLPDESYFHYTHGLPEHDGLCHRLLHGHCSKLAVFKNQRRSHASEKDILDNLFCGRRLHLAECSQIVSPRSLAVGEVGPKGETYELFYNSKFGEFSAKIPAHRVFVIAGATSIESFAYALHSYLQKKDPESDYRVRVYEGIGKGAIAGS